MLYFAYGSNMHHVQMKFRCPASRFIGPASLPNHRFVYDGYSRSCRGAVPNIVRSRGEAVWGGLYEINGECLKALDEYEGFPRSYQRKTVAVRDTTGRPIHAIVYYRTGRRPAISSEGFHSLVLQGAKDCRLPKSYVRRCLETLGPL
jgi:gamma-glutamylcyclotransferase (GGCT)/AIG2-like uncharacterized protein YtfP